MSAYPCLPDWCMFYRFSDPLSDWSALLPSVQPDMAKVSSLWRPDHSCWLTSARTHTKQVHSIKSSTIRLKLCINYCLVAYEMKRFQFAYAIGTWTESGMNQLHVTVFIDYNYPTTICHHHQITENQSNESIWFGRKQDKTGMILWKTDSPKGIPQAKRPHKAILFKLLVQQECEDTSIHGDCHSSRTDISKSTWTWFLANLTGLINRIL